MKLSKAIEIQKVHNDHNPNFTDAEREEAHQLGIEAMQTILELRKVANNPYRLLLDSETAPE